MNLSEVENFFYASVEQGKLANSYILYGGDKSEREAAALFFARLIHCKKKDGPCSQCSACVAISKRYYPDVKWIVPVKSVLSIDQVREIIGDVYLTPYGGARKTYILDINYIRPEAANAFLKVLEEPPEYVNILILSSSINYFLPTIISRCQRIRLNYKLADRQEELRASHSEFLQLLSLLKEGRYSEFFKTLEALIKLKGREGTEIWLEHVLYLYRNKLLEAEGLSLSDFFTPYDDDVLSKIDIPDAELMEKIMELKSRIKYNINLKLGVENLLFQILARSNR